MRHVVLGLVAALAQISESAIQAQGKEFVVIAHRGASGYLPEHTLASMSMAFAMNVDFIEQDVVLTRDEVPIVLHDIHLDSVTNVAAIFPGRARDDGRYYAIDFTLEEIRRLSVHERIDLETGLPVFDHRFPVGKSSFGIPTLADAIELIQGLNRSTGKNVGIYTEIKAPKWHRGQGRDLSEEVLKVLHDHGYRSRQDPVFLQCFDPVELRRIREELGCSLKLVQLIGGKAATETRDGLPALGSAAGIKVIAEFADGIGPSLDLVVQPRSEGREFQITNLVQLAHDQGLVVHPYTFRVDDLPDYADSFSELLDLFVMEAKVDGVFTDFPDRVRK